MSGKLSYALAFSSLFVFGFGLSWTVEKNSTPTSDEMLLAGIKNRSTISMEKHLRPVTITLVSPGELSSNPDDITEVKALLRTRHGFSQIQYQWVLPESVEVIQGHQNSYIQNPEAMKEYEISLLVKGFDNLERKEISLRASVVDDQGETLGNSAVITSRPEDSFEHIAPEVMVKAEQLKASQKLERMPASKDDEQ